MFAKSQFQGNKVEMDSIEDDQNINLQILQKISELEELMEKNIQLLAREQAFDNKENAVEKESDKEVDRDGGEVLTDKEQNLLLPNNNGRHLDKNIKLTFDVHRKHLTF